jgi:trigger factor
MEFAPQFQVSEIDQFGRKVTITIPQAFINAEFKQRYDQLNHKFGVPGFRKGKAPSNLLKQKYGEQVTFEIHDKLVNNGWRKAVEDLNLAPVTQPELLHDKLVSANADFSFSLSFEVAPKIELSSFDWKSIEVTQKDWQLSDERLQAEIDALAQKNGEWTEIDSASVKGNQVSFSLTGEVDGVTVEQLSTPEEKCILGKGELLAEIEAALEGKKAGESFSAEITFPQSNPSFAGKQGQFSGTVLSVSQNQPVSLEELITKLKAENEEDLKQKVSTALITQYQDRSKHDARQELLTKLKSYFSFDLPAKLLLQQISRIEEQEYHNHEHGEDCDHDHDHHDHGHIHSDSCGHAIDPTKKTEAEQMLRFGFVMDQIIEAQQLSVSDNEINRTVSQILMSTNFNMELFQLYQQEGPRRRLKESLLEEKALNWLLTQVSIKSEAEAIPAIEG